MIKLMDLIKETINYDNGVWYHGSASGDLRGGQTGLHLGTYKAAKDALEATIGVPLDGEWDGAREYGKTLLCGKHSLKIKNKNITGFNCSVPDEDFYPNDDSSPIIEWRKGHLFNYKLDNRPSIKKYRILCPMSNTNMSPYEDFKANGYMRASLKRGNAKRGFYYRNVAEDFGSISVVVPNGSCVKEI